MGKNDISSYSGAPADGTLRAFPGEGRAGHPRTAGPGRRAGHRVEELPAAYRPPAAFDRLLAVIDRPLAAIDRTLAAIDRMLAVFDRTPAGFDGMTAGEYRMAAVEPGVRADQAGHVSSCKWCSSVCAG